MFSRAEISVREIFYKKQKFVLTTTLVLAIIIKQSFLRNNRYAAVLELVDRPA